MAQTMCSKEPQGLPLTDSPEKHTTVTINLKTNKFPLQYLHSVYYIRVYVMECPDIRTPPLIMHSPSYIGVMHKTTIE